MAKPSKNNTNLVWDAVPDLEKSFLNTERIKDVNIEEYLPERMTLFSANLSYARQLPKVADGLKPINRRIMINMYKDGLRYDKKAAKASLPVSNTMAWHPHADSSIYSSLVGMSQQWKNRLALVDFIGNNGSTYDPEGYAAMRYTEARISRYGWECFFEDFDPQCLEMIHNYTKDEEEAFVLPSKYPNILLNGDMGIAVGNAYAIPPYRPEDVVGLIKKLMRNPYAKDCVLIPDIPTECELIDDGNFVKIAETGEGVLTMRAVIDISEDRWSPSGKHTKPVWVLTVRSVPWMTSLKKISDSIIKLAKEKSLSILDIKDNTQMYRVNKDLCLQKISFEIIIDHNLDPYQVRAQLYSKTDLQKSQSIQFKAVTDDLKVKTFNLRELALQWIDGRREYKRRHYNRKLRSLMDDISFYEVMINITSGNKIDKTVAILRKTKRDDQLQQMMVHGPMSSHQAAKVLQMRMSTISSEANEEFKRELKKTEEELEKVKEILRSEKKIDEIIIDELEDLKKFYTPRISKVVTLDDQQVISDQKVALIVTKKGKVKKIPDHNGKRTLDEIRDLFNGVKSHLGSFDQYDYPTHAIYVHNYDAVTFIDSLGRYSTIPVSIIPNTEMANTGYKLYDYTRLDGEIIDVFECSTPEEDTKKVKLLTGNNVSQVFLTSQGMVKQIPLTDFMLSPTARKIRNQKCMKLKDGDTLAWTGAMLDGTNLLIYTRKGEYAYVNAGNIPMSNKDTMGNIGVKCREDDSCVGCCVIDNSPYMLIVTSKGCVKRVETNFLGEPGKRMRSSYLAEIDANDDIITCITCKDEDELVVVSKSGIKTLMVSDIPVLGRKAKPRKMIPVALGDVISTVYTRKPQN